MGFSNGKADSSVRVNYGWRLSHSPAGSMTPAGPIPVRALAGEGISYEQAVVVRAGALLKSDEPLKQPLALEDSGRDPGQAFLQQDAELCAELEA